MLDDFYGVDLMFSDDLQVGAHGDYLVDEGREALRQAIYRRLMVVPGEYALRPDYGAGLPLYVKKRPTPAILDELRQKILEQLAQDDRIERVIEVVTEAATFSGSPGLRVYVKVRAMGQELPFTFKAV